MTSKDHLIIVLGSCFIALFVHFSEIVIKFSLGITTAAFLAMKDVFLSQLQKIMRQQYPTSVAKLWCAYDNYEG